MAQITKSHTDYCAKFFWINGVACSNSLFYPTHTTSAATSVFTSKVNLTARDLRFQLTVEFWQLTTETGSASGHLHELRFNKSYLTILWKVTFCPDMFCRLRFRHTERRTSSPRGSAPLEDVNFWPGEKRSEVKWSFTLSSCPIWRANTKPAPGSRYCSDFNLNAFDFFSTRSHDGPRTQIETSEGKRKNLEAETRLRR